MLFDIQRDGGRREIRQFIAKVKDNAQQRVATLMASAIACTRTTIRARS
jgi:hypothetical protein